MGVISGIGGAVDLVPCVREWSIDESADIPGFSSSCSDGAENAAVGNIDWSGVYRAYGAVPIHFPGDKFTFSGNMGNSKGAASAANGAVVTQVQISWDIEGALPIEYIVNFGSTGSAITYGASTAADPVGVDLEMPSKICKAAWWTGLAEEEILDVRRMSITLNRGEATFASSSTSGQKGRTTGNLNVTGTMSLYVDDLAASYLKALNSISALRLYVDATEYYQINRAIVQQRAPRIQIEGNPPTPVEMDYAWKWKPFFDDTGTPTKGSIAKPATPGGNVWP